MPATKPVSESHLAADSANARSSQNAVKHIFTAASFTVLSLEEQRDLETLEADAVAFYRPANSQEQLAIDRIALAQMHMRRGARLEAGFFAAALNQSGAAKNQQANVSLAEGLLRVTQESNAWALLLRYQAKAERDYRRAVQEWERLNAMREEMQNEPIEETRSVEPETLVHTADGASSVSAIAESGQHASAAGFAACPQTSEAERNSPAPNAFTGAFPIPRPPFHSSREPGAINSHINSRPIASQLQC